jgi:hypothetical protein
MDYKRVPKALTFIALLLILAGCENSRARYQAVLADCVTNYPAVVGRMVAYQQCIIGAHSQLQYSEREPLIMARFGLAEQVDRRLMSISEAEYRFAQLNNE